MILTLFAISSWGQNIVNADSFTGKEQFLSEAEKREREAEKEWQFCTAYKELYGYGGKPNRAKALEEFKRLSDEGVIKAGYMVGVYYINEEGICDAEGTEMVRDYDKALKIFSKYANMGCPYAKFWLAKCYRFGYGVLFHKVGWSNAYAKKAYEGLLELANKNDAEAQYFLAIMYRNGMGVEQSYEKAIQWYKKAADQKHAHALQGLSEMYFEAKGVPNDMTYGTMREIGTKYLKRSVETGFPPAMQYLANLHERGVIRPSAEDLGSKSNVEYVIWTKKASQLGYRYSTLCLSDIYKQGIGVPIDVSKALQLQERAAKEGDPEAQYRMGEDYREGVICPKDLKVAEFWYKKAARQDMIKAQQMLDIYF